MAKELQLEKTMNNQKLLQALKPYLNKLPKDNHFIVHQVKSDKRVILIMEERRIQIDHIKEYDSQFYFVSGTSHWSYRFNIDFCHKLELGTVTIDEVIE